MAFGLGKKSETRSSRPLSMMLPDNVKLFSKKSRNVLDRTLETPSIVSERRRSRNSSSTDSSSANNRNSAGSRHSMSFFSPTGYRSMSQASNSSTSVNTTSSPAPAPQMSTNSAPQPRKSSAAYMQALRSPETAPVPQTSQSVHSSEEKTESFAGVSSISPDTVSVPPVVPPVSLNVVPPVVPLVVPPCSIPHSTPDSACDSAPNSAPVILTLPNSIPNSATSAHSVPPPHTTPTPTPTPTPTLNHPTTRKPEESVPFLTLQLDDSHDESLMNLSKHYSMLPASPDDCFDLTHSPSETLSSPCSNSELALKLKLDSDLTPQGTPVITGESEHPSEPSSAATEEFLFTDSSYANVSALSLSSRTLPPDTDNDVTPTVGADFDTNWKVKPRDTPVLYQLDQQFMVPDYDDSHLEDVSTAPSSMRSIDELLVATNRKVVFNRAVYIFDPAVNNEDLKKMTLSEDDLFNPFEY